MIIEMNEMRVRADAIDDFVRLYRAQRRTRSDGLDHGPLSSRLFRKVGTTDEYAVVVEWESVEDDVQAERVDDGRDARRALLGCVEERLRKSRWEEVSA